jgi:hypothetical protein
MIAPFGNHIPFLQVIVLALLAAIGLTSYGLMVATLRPGLEASRSAAARRTSWRRPEFVGGCVFILIGVILG